MTTIDVYRWTTTDDEYGDPQPAERELFGSFDGKVGWGNPDEPLEPGRNTVITNRTVYIRGDQPSGILATDQVEIDGVKYDVDGAVAEWGDPHKGTQFAVKAVS